MSRKRGVPADLKAMAASLTEQAARAGVLDAGEPIEDAMAERRAAEAKLTAAGFPSTGGGMGFGGWDTFIEDPDEPDDERGFSSMAEVDAFLAERRGRLA